MKKEKEKYEYGGGGEWGRAVMNTHLNICSRITTSIKLGQRLQNNM